MIKTKGHYPYKQVLYFSNKKIIGKADESELSILLDILSSEISKMCDSLTKEEIKEILSKSILYFTTLRRPSFAGAEACAIGKKIFIDEEILEYINNGNKDELRYQEIYRCLLHESIHVIQNYFSKKMYYKGHDIKGLVEGATEKAVIDRKEKTRSMVYNGIFYNFRTSAASYAFPISIMNQLEFIFGREIVNDFTYKQDLRLIDEMVNFFGRDFTYTLLDETKKSVKSSKFKYNLSYFQDYIMQIYFSHELSNVTSSSAEEMLNKMKKFELLRMKIGEENTFEKYYNKVLQNLLERFPEIDKEKCKYTEPNYLPIVTLRDAFIKIKNSIVQGITNCMYKSDLSISEIMQNIEKIQFDNIELHLYDTDESIVAVCKVTDDLYFYFNTKLFKKDYPYFSMCVNTLTEDNSKITFNDSLGKVYFINQGTHSILSNDSNDEITLTKIHINISKKDIIKELKTVIEDEIYIEKSNKIRKFVLQQKKDLFELENSKTK